MMSSLHERRMAAVELSKYTGGALRWGVFLVLVGLNGRKQGSSCDFSAKAGKETCSSWGQASRGHNLAYDSQECRHTRERCILDKTTLDKGKTKLVNRMWREIYLNI